jgi:hypothetical protein
MVGQALMGIKTADGKQNFKTYLHFVNFKLRSPSCILLSVSALHAIRGFRMQICSKGYLIIFSNSSKGNQRPFCKLQEGIRLPHAILLHFHGFFGFCMRYLITFCKLQKGIWYLLELDQKGANNPFKQCNISICMWLLHETILYL